MRRIDTATKAVDLFGAGKHGFKDGDPALAILATKLNAGFFNSIQEELSGAIEGAGLTLSPADNTQLLAAITALARGVLPKRSFAANDYIRIPDVPGGLIIQFGTVAATANSTTTVTLPVTFPGGCLAIVVSVDDNVATVTSYPFSAAKRLSSSQFSLRSYYSQSGILNDWIAVGY